MKGRRITGLIGSVAAHAALLAWVVGQPEPEPEPDDEPELVSVEVVEVSPPRPGVLSTQAEIPGDPGRRPAVTIPVEPEVDEPPPPPPPRPSPAVTRPEPSPTTSSPAPSDPEPEPEPPTAPVDDDAGSDADASPEPGLVADEDATGPSSTDGREGGVESSLHGEGSTRPSGGLTGDGELDHSAYGAEIVRLVLAEIDDDPVPGIPEGHAIQIELRVLPSGRLSPRGLGRFDFARVVRSTLGPVRTRWVLRRVERASKRFPPHPDGFSRKVYEMDFTVRFTGGRAG